MTLLVERPEDTDSATWFKAIYRIDQIRQVNKVFQLT